MRYKLFFLTLFYIITVNTLFAEIKTDSITLDHKVFIEEINNSQGLIFSNIIKKYNAYIVNHPYDVKVRIEKCKFIQLAQYNDNEEYNPNQDLLDSCITELEKLFPNNPDVLVYQTTYLYGDKKFEILEKAKNSIDENSDLWTKNNIAIIYYELSLHYNEESDFTEAHNYMLKAIFNNIDYNTSLDHVKILINLKRNNEALKILIENKDTIQNLFHLSQKAELFIQLKKYAKALEIYKRINEKDSSFVNNKELAETMEGVGEFNLARKYLIADTINNWNLKNALLNLFVHDLKYHNADTCLSSYNAFRELGYKVDPLALYRLKLFIAKPFLSWKLHDFLGLFSLLLAFILFIILPSVWILPIYFIGHKWKIVDNMPSETFTWGLKSFWWVSSGYLIASFISLIITPDYLYSLGSVSEYTANIFQYKKGFNNFLFFSFFSFFGFASLYKANFRLIIPKVESIKKLIGTTIGIFVIFKVATVIYVLFAAQLFKFRIEEITACPNILFASKALILDFMSGYGKLAALLVLGVVVPFYEEIIFRGVVLESCTRYIHFKWANILQAAIFASLHGSLVLFPVFFGFGMIVSILNKRFGGLYSGILFHIINNTLVILTIIAKG